jgi:protein TonB
LVFEKMLDPVVEPTLRDIPVEIILEPPPEKPAPAPAAPEPSPAARSLNEEPAFDAPRRSRQEKSDKQASDAPAKAQGAPPHAAPSNPPTEAVQPAPKGEAQAAENSAEPSPDKPDAEVTRPLQPAPEKPEPPQARAEAKAEPPKLPSLVGQPFPAWSSAAQLPTYEPLADIGGGGAEADPIAEGQAKATYLSTLYGMVVPRMHLPEGLRAKFPNIEGVVSFVIGGTGKLTQRRIERSSGSRELDAAALAALAAAAPFPPPPGGEPVALKFSYGAK